MIIETQIIGTETDKDESLTTESALEHLKSAFSPASPPEGFVQGRTEMRNALAERSGCSLARAEALVDTLVAQKAVHYRGHSFAPEEIPASWEFDS